MEAEPLTREYVLDKVLAIINAEFERPANSFTAKEIAQHARDNGQDIEDETMRSRLEAQIKAGKMEKIKQGRATYYRIIESEE